jgi:Na+-driven multidrug efflux pump
MTADWKPKLDAWKRMLAIGLPSGFEFALMAVYMMIVYTISRPFGAAAQAGFGIGGRIVQAGFMPVVALGFSVAPVAGQNFGARQAQRVRDTFKNAAVMAVVFMILLAIVCQVAPAQLVGFFTNDPAVVEVGVEYLRILSISYIASGLIFVNSSMFQAMGNTMPSLIASATRIILVAVPAIMLSHRPGFELVWVWWLSAASIAVQLVLSLVLLRREFNRKLTFGAAASSIGTASQLPIDQPEGMAQVS